MTEDNETEMEDSSGKEELSFQEIYAAAALNGEIIIVIHKDEVERVKTGLKNFKAKQAAKMKAEGLVPDTSIFTFVARDRKDDPDFVDLSIALSRKSTVVVKEIKIPDQDF